MYNDFDLISSEIIVAEVKQRLKSYFDSGSITEAMIPTYIDNALRKLKRLVLEFKEDVIEVENFKAKLPEDFAYLKDAYLCNRIETYTTELPTNEYTYYKKIYCNDTCNTEYEEFTQVTCETPNYIMKLLDPRKLKVYKGSKGFCTADCQGLSISSNYEIRLTKRTMSTNFETGTIYVRYFTRPVDEHGPLVPDLIEVEEYVKAYLFFQFFEDLMNSVTDESINIIKSKLDYYRGNYYRKFEAASNMLKLQSEQQIIDGINKQRRRFIKYVIH